MWNPKSRELIHVASATAFLFIVLVSFGISSGIVWGTGSTSVTVDYSTIVGTNRLSVGFGLDWESRAFCDSSSLGQLAKDGNFKLVRLFSVRIEPCLRWYESTNTGAFNWANVDLLMRRIFEIGAEPLICFGYFNNPGRPPTVPPGMAINAATNLPFPVSYATYCAEWVKHFKTIGLPVRYYEIMNEPFFYYGWDSSETTLIGNFVQLLNTVARSMRNVNPGILVGNNAFLQKKFLDYFVKYGDDLNFIAFSKYGLGENNGTDATAFYKAKTQYFSVNNSVLYTVDQGRTIWNTKRGTILPVIFTESNFSYAWTNGSDSRIQQMAGAVYTALVLKESVLRGLSYHCYYVFSASPYNQHGSNGFGMVNTDNSKPWYPYYVQKWLGTSLGVGDKLAVLTASSSEISGFAWTHNQKLYFLLICEVNEPRTIYFSGLKGSLNFTKIDNAIPWQTPKEQTGTIDSSASFNMNGYTVALFQAQASAPPSVTLFADGFESGTFSAWSGTYGTINVAKTVPPGSHDGTYYSKSSIRTYGDFSRTVKKLGSTYSALYVRMYVRMEDLFTAGKQGLGPRFSNTDNSAAIGYVLVDCPNNKWGYQVLNTGLTSHFEASSSMTIQADRWYCIEFYMSIGPKGTCTLWVDGVQRLTGTYDNDAKGNIGYVSANAYCLTTMVASRAWYGDGFVCATTYIGP